MKTTTLFRACKARDDARRIMRMTWGVFCVKKDGALYKTPSVMFGTEEEARAKAIYMEQINVGSRFEAHPLN
ncbi:MAG: hypothetical protein A2Z99_20500 [Treponema sp. GWB1_62_6]|nr:MAG: hypothetical protein A2Z99_20500 [Treponema sp. GWB1_62_6]